MDDRARRELGRSFRLLADEERSLFGAAVVGAVAYPVWIAGTGVAAIATADATLGGVSTSPWSGEATALAAVLGILWVVVPAAVAVWYVERALRNVSGNLERHYRVANPQYLLIPPALALVAIAAVAVAVGSANGWIALALGVAAGLLLVRTVAFGYRVFALSRPMVLRGLVFLAGTAAALAALTRVAPLVGQDAVVDGAMVRAGVEGIASGTTTSGGVAVSTLPAAAALAPALLAALYLLAHGLAAAVVRIREPDVQRSEIRPGQRYPEAVRPSGVDRAAAAAEDADRDGPGGGADADASPGDGSSGASAATPKAATAADGSAAEHSPSETTGSDEGEGGETVGHTRVFTPPDDLEGGPGSDARTGSAADTLSEPDESTGEPVDETAETGGVADSARNRTRDGSDDTPNTDAQAAGDRCPICDASHAPDARKCPNCNARLD